LSPSLVCKWTAAGWESVFLKAGFQISVPDLPPVKPEEIIDVDEESESLQPEITARHIRRQNDIHREMIHDDDRVSLTINSVDRTQACRPSHIETTMNMYRQFKARRDTNGHQ
jgi:hypothetical protein